MLLPALTRAKQKVQDISCMNNMKQLVLAVIMFAGDNNGFWSPNPDGTQVPPLENAQNRAWVGGKMSLSGGNTDNANTLKLVGDAYSQYGSLEPYSKNAKIYHRPADEYGASGQDIRVRLCSMNGYAAPYHDAATEAAVSPIRYGTVTNSRNEYNLKDNSSHSRAVAVIFIFVEERTNCLNDGCFWSPGKQFKLRDLAGIFHHQSSFFAYADGHAELHRWHDGGFIALTAGGKT